MQVPPLYSRRALLFLLALTLVSGAVMLPSLKELADNGTPILEIEFAGSAAEMAQIRVEMDDAAREALWIQLLIDVPFLIGYGLLTAAVCMWCSERAAAAGRIREAGWAASAAFLGPLGAAFDMAQNISLAFVNGGHIDQPWPRISQLAGYCIFICIGIAIAFAVIALVASRAGDRAAEAS